MVLIFFMLAVAFLLSCTSIERDSVCDEKSVKYNGCVGIVPSDGDRFIDSRDNKSYRYVNIGEQTWMAENLNYAALGKCYDNKESNCATYGRLYDWATAMDLPEECNSDQYSCASQIKAKHQGICPGGWRIPNNDDWNNLVNYVEINKHCVSCVDRYLKSTSGWVNEKGEPMGNGNDDFGFSALPGGYGFSNGSFRGVGYDGYWLSTSGGNSKMILSYKDGYVTWTAYNKTSFGSVRCVKDYTLF
ncbi:MAG: hypothetical protein LBC75_11545 [Fibromonadaceae bacterium]|jgi:uncharacterized protein (TIGR02145 family)|nr:hypothetical protein [Fibromonadaceae bacterium]